MATANDEPRFRIRDATPADADKLVDVFEDAFGASVLTELTHPGGMDPKRSSCSPSSPPDGAGAGDKR